LSPNDFWDRFKVVRVGLGHRVFLVRAIIEETLTSILFCLILHSLLALLRAPEVSCANKVPFFGDTKLGLEDLIEI